MITCLQPVRSGKLPYGAIAQLPDARPSLFFFSWGARLVPCLSAALRISRRPYRPRPRWVGWQTTSRLADWHTAGEQRVRTASVQRAASAQLVPHGWGMAICISPACQAFLSLHTIASFRAARFGTAPCRDANVAPLPARRQPVSHPFWPIAILTRLLICSRTQHAAGRLNALDGMYLPLGIVRSDYRLRNSRLGLGSVRSFRCHDSLRKPGSQKKPHPTFSGVGALFRPQPRETIWMAERRHG